MLIDYYLYLASGYGEGDISVIQKCIVDLSAKIERLRLPDIPAQDVEKIGNEIRVLVGNMVYVPNDSLKLIEGIAHDLGFIAENHRNFIEPHLRSLN